MRKDWDEYFLGIAEAAATRATCNRKHVGCVLVRDNAIVATGYNGSIAGLPHCDDEGHMMVDKHCVRNVHAEANAITQAAKHGHATHGAIAYITCSPCWDCFKLLVNAGIYAIFFGEQYGITDHALLSQTLGIGYTCLRPSPPPVKSSTASTGQILSFDSLAQPLARGRSRIR